MIQILVMSMMVDRNHMPVDVIVTTIRNQVIIIMIIMTAMIIHIGTTHAITTIIVNI